MCCFHKKTSVQKMDDEGSYKYPSVNLICKIFFLLCKLAVNNFI
jgi:hypothetical protein